MTTPRFLWLVLLLAAVPVRAAAAQAHMHHGAPADTTGAAADAGARPGSWSIRGAITHSGLNEGGTDASLSLGVRGHRATGRLVHGRSYTDAAGRSYGARYGYAGADVSYRRYDVDVQGGSGRWAYGASFDLGEDVPSPHLRMDERLHHAWSTFVRYRGQQLRVHRMYHRMDDGLRAHASGMSMRHEALAVSLSGRFYEVSYRHRDDWHTMAMQHDGMPMDGMSRDGTDERQHLMPDVELLSAEAMHTIARGVFTLTGRVGIQRTSLRDRERLAFYLPLHADAARSRWFVPFHVTAAYTTGRSDGHEAGAAVEAASTPPALEALYVALHRTMGGPSWSGNPTLAAAKRATLRGFARTSRLSGELFLSMIRDFATVAPAGHTHDAFTTFINVDALLAGLEVKANGRYFDLNASYTWAQDLAHEAPLPEIAPLEASGTLKTPAYGGGLRLYLSGTVAAAQRRTATRLGEDPTPAWMRLDAGAAYTIGLVEIAADMANLTNALYYRHLTYVSSPFASGARVYAPGRSLCLSIRLHT